MNPFGRSTPTLDPADTFIPAHLPEPDPFLREHTVLVDDAHVAFHRVVADAFEAFGVYDATFGYNLAALNRDPRHPNAGFRYAIERDAPSTLRAVFTPTTAFCPQAEPLALGAVRALNTVDTHEYDSVRIRVPVDLKRGPSINERLKTFESASESAPESTPESTETPVVEDGRIPAADLPSRVDTAATRSDRSNTLQEQPDDS